jgi:hypothetical protein
MQAERATQHEDAAVAHGADVFIGDIVGQGNDGIACVALRLAADLQFAASQIDPLGGEVDVAIISEAELAVDGEAAQRWGRDVEDDAAVARNGHRVAGTRHLAIGPGLGVRPARLLHCLHRRLVRHAHVGMIMLRAGRRP